MFADADLVGEVTTPAQVLAQVGGKAGGEVVVAGIQRGGGRGGEVGVFGVESVQRVPAAGEPVGYRVARQRSQMVIRDTGDPQVVFQQSACSGVSL